MAEYIDGGKEYYPGIGKIKYEAGAAVGPDEACAGVLCLDAVTGQATIEPWPTPRQPSGPTLPCGAAASMIVTVKYVTCVTTMSTTGAPPPEAKAKAEQLALMDLGWDVWSGLLDQERVWAKRYGTARVGTLSRLPDVGGASGFSTSMTCKIATRCS